MDLVGASVQNCDQAANAVGGMMANVPTHPVLHPGEIFPGQWDLVMPRITGFSKRRQRWG